MRKTFWDGTHRTRHPQATLDTIRPLLSRFGVTRLADVTGLDDIGIPVYMAVRPLGLSLSVSQGKGSTRAAARVSGAMEAIELWHAEHAVPSAAVTDTAARDLHLPYQVRDLEQHRGSLLTETTRLDWITARCLTTGEPVLLPREAVTMGRQIRPDWRTYMMRASSNGVASGNTPAEAVVHGLYELAERDALDALDQPGAIRQVLDIATVDDPHCRELIDKIHACGAWLEICHVPTRFGFPCLLAYMWREDQGAAIVSGAGSHSSPAIALSRAVAEAAQTRLTFITGSRDDIVPRLYAGGDYQRPDDSPPEVTWPQITAQYTAQFDDVDNEAAWAAERVTAITGIDPMVVDLTSGSYAREEFHVVKVAAPGLGFSGRQHVGRPGQETWE